MSLISNIKSLVVRATEGATRPGPYWLPISGGWLSAEAGSFWNFWQKGYDVAGVSPSALVECCISAYAQTIAMCPGDHWWTNPNGGRERVTTSALSRFLKKPNAYQSISDFLLDAVGDLYTHGNAYALALRNSRYEINEIHLMNARQCAAYVAEGGEIFYSLAGNEVIDRQLEYAPIMVPQRDVLHIRLNTSDSNMLLGESPILAVARDIAAGDAMLQQQISFYLNQARPSFVLMTDRQLTKVQANDLRDRWNEQAVGLNSGKTPILSDGLKAQAIATNAVDSQLAEIMKLSDQRIALAFRIPLQILGLGGGTYGSTEVLMQSWIASGLGFTLNHIEECIGNLFQLKGQPDEYLEFDTSALLRSEMKNRVEAFARSVQSGIHSPNEARSEFDLPEKEYGDEPRMQAQVVPLSAATGIPSAPAAPSSPAALTAPEDSSNVDTTAKLARLVAGKVNGKNILVRSSRLAQRSPP